jgi:flagellar biosynthetic protein FlhB
MADERDDNERTEDPTPRRLEEALKRGDVVKSAEVNTWFMIAAGTLMLMVFAAPMAADLQTTLRGVLANSGRIATDAPALAALAKSLALSAVTGLAIPLLLLCLAAALAGNVVQHRILLSPEPLRPRLSRISPAAGLSRLLSRQALANFAKGLAKLAVVGAVMTALLWPERDRLRDLVGVDPTLILPFTRSLAMHMLGAVVAILAIVAAADYLFQYRQWYERHKMSLRELKEEFRQTEGDPTVKGKLRQLRQTRMRKRMMAAVPRPRWSSPIRPISPSRSNTNAA